MSKELPVISESIRYIIKLLIFTVLVSVVWGQESAVISGFVTDEKSGESIYGANIFLKDTPYGSVSNIEGYYVLSNIPPGDYTYVVSFIGYKRFERKISLGGGETRVLNAALQSEILTGQAVYVSGERTAFKRQIQLSQINMSPRQIASMPRVGEVDLFRALQQLPGVNAENDFSAGLIVRGGDTDQNLILLDGITVYNPSHLMGMFSNFITDGLRDAELIKGGIPAEYGGRLSSVLNVRSKDGNQKKNHFKGEISMISSKLLAEGPIPKGAWVVAARRTYVDKMLAGFRKLNLTDFELPYYFYDVQANVFQNITDNDRLSFSAYFGDDVLDWTAANMYFSWGNKTISSRLRHIFSQSLFSNFMVAYSRFDIRTEFGGDDAVHEEDEIKDFTMKGDLTYYHSGEHEFKFGFELKNLDISYRSWFGEDEQFRLEQQPVYGGFYSQLNWHPKGWVLVTGLRLNYYDAIKQKFRLAPRFSLKRLVGEWSAITFSINRYYQYIFTFNDEFNMRILNAWVAQDTTIATPYSNELLIGFNTKITQGIDATVEAYYRRMYNLYVFKNVFASFDQEIINPRSSDFFEPTDAEAMGIEFLFQRNFGRLSGLGSYTLSWVVKQIADEPRYWANWDRRHNVKLILNWRINQKWDLATTLNAYSGVPYTPILGFFTYYEPGYSNPIYFEIPGTRNSKRLPYYERFDLGLTRHFTFKTWKMDVYFSLINLTNHENIFRIVYDTSPLNEGQPPVLNKLKMFPLIPIIGVRGEF
ncbi:MAG: TonB-dependent receptor [FCB group bacterium]|nr:TonB-dependent receptor [FCB group bacterium]